VLSISEIARGTQGAFGFLQRDRAAPLQFDNTMEACLRSFQVMILAAPLFVLYLLLRYSQVLVTADETEIAIVEALRYVVDWLIYPVLFYEIARRRGLLDRYPRYIAALNWINLPEMIVLLVGESIASVMPVNFAVILQLGLQALFSAVAGGRSPQTASMSSPLETAWLARIASMPSTACCRRAPSSSSPPPRHARSGPSTCTRSGCPSPATPVTSALMGRRPRAHPEPLLRSSNLL